VSGEKIGLTDMDNSQTDVLVRVAPLDRPVQTLRLTAAQPIAEISERPNVWQVARTYFLIGIDHILFGYDHLLFVIALVLLLGGGWIVVKAITAFTVAHSITLIGTTLGFFGLPQRPVESVIALSIVFLALEIAKQVPGKPRLSERMPWLIAFVFGLLHGFGFAGALKEIGLPEGEVPSALLTFNIGVEFGQLLIIFATLTLLLALKRWSPSFARPVIRLATLGIGITASFWFIERTFA
jgi:hydrogenase/urease accessory protein HupE